MNQANQSEHQILEILKRRGLLSSTAIKCLIGFMEKWSVDAYRATIETHCLEESRLADILAEEFHLNRVARLRSRTIENDALKFVSYQDAMAKDMIPYVLEGEENLHIAIADPTRKSEFDKVVADCKRNVVFEIAERSEIDASIQRHYPLSMQLPKTMSEGSQHD